MKKISAVIIGVACMATFAFAGAISIGSTPFTYTQDFSALGTGTVAWVDGETIQGVYLKCLNTVVYPTGVPTSLAAATGGQSSAGAYNLGLSGDSDRALGWLTASGTQAAYTGIQFRDQTGSDNAKTINYSFVLEQWGDRNTAAQTFTLQYKKQSSNGNTNTLDSSGWIDLGTAVTPATGDGVAPFELNGNLNQFTIAGTTNIDIHHGQFLTFRLVDIDHSGGDAMVGINSISLEVIPEPATIGLFMISGIGALVFRRLTH